MLNETPLVQPRPEENTPEEYVTISTGIVIGRAASSTLSVDVTIVPVAPATVHGS